MFVIMDNIMKRPVLATDCIVKKIMYISTKCFKETNN